MCNDIDGGSCLLCSLNDIDGGKLLTLFNDIDGGEVAYFND